MVLLIASMVGRVFEGKVSRYCGTYLVPNAVVFGNSGCTTAADLVAVVPCPRFLLKRVAVSWCAAGLGLNGLLVTRRRRPHTRTCFDVILPWG